MAQQGLIGGGGPSTNTNFAASTVYYLPLASGSDPFNPATLTNNWASFVAKVAFTASLLCINVGANTRTTSTNLAFFNNGSSGAQNVPVSGGATGHFQDTTHTDSVAAGAYYNALWGLGTGTGSIGQAGAFAAISTTGQIEFDLGGGTTSNAAAGTFMAFAGGGSMGTTEAVQALGGMESATLSGLALNVSSFTGAGPATFVSRLNAANGAQTISVAASTTGFFQDTTHTDALTSAKTFDATCVQSGTLIASTYGVHYSGAPTGSVVPNYSAVALNGGMASTSVTWGLRGSGGAAPLTDSAANEVKTATIIPYAGTLSGMRHSITTASTSGTITLWTAGSAALTQTVPLPSSTTGVFQDTTHTDPVVAGGLYCYVGMTGLATAVRAWSGILLAAPVPVAGAGAIHTHTVIAGKGAAQRPEPFTILTRTVVAGRTAVQVQATGTIHTHTAVAGAGIPAKQAAGAITTHTVVAGKGLTAGQSVGRIATHTAVAGVSAATAASSFQINTATDVEGAGVSIWDWMQTVISQYANSPSMLALIEDFAFYLNQNTNFQSFYDQVWNVDTAVGWGLDVWGRIVGVDRVLTISTEAYFSFQQAHNIGPGDPFGGGAFFSGENATANFSLSDDAFRQLILAKAAANICDGSIPAINSILMMLFAELGNCYCTDLGNMQMTYTFSSPLNPVQYAIITESGVLPKPVGVAASIVQL